MSSRQIYPVRLVHSARLLAFLVTPALLLAPRLALAQEEAPNYARPGFYLGIGAAVGTFTTLEREFEDALADLGNPTDVDVSAGVGLSALLVGFRWGSWVATELDYDRLFGVEISAFGLKQFEFDSWSVMINTKVYPLHGRFQPYASIGIGSSAVKMRDATDGDTELKDHTFAAQFGVGLDSYLNEHIVVVLDGSYTLATSGLESYDRFVGSLGLAYRF